MALSPIGVTQSFEGMVHKDRQIGKWRRNLASSPDRPEKGAEPANWIGVGTFSSYHGYLETLETEDFANVFKNPVSL